MFRVDEADGASRGNGIDGGGTADRVDGLVVVDRVDVAKRSGQSR